MPLYAPRNVLFASIAIVLASGFFAPFVAMGPKTQLCLTIGMCAWKTSYFLFQGSIASRAPQVLSYVFNVLLFAAPATAFYYLTRTRRSVFGQSLLVAWLGCYLLMLFFILPARPTVGPH